MNDYIYIKVIILEAKQGGRRRKWNEFFQLNYSILS